MLIFHLAHCTCPNYFYDADATTTIPVDYNSLYSKDRKNQHTRLPDLVKKVFLKPAEVFMKQTYNYAPRVEDQRTNTSMIFLARNIGW